MRYSLSTRRHLTNAPRTGWSLLVTCFVFLFPLAGRGEDEAKPITGTVRADDGLKLVCDIRGKGDTALVFLHGWCGNREWWKYQVDVFADNYRVVAMDQAGHGESGKDRETWTVGGLAADVQAVVKQLGLKRVILVGHSMGGPIALAAAIRMPGTIVAVIGAETLQNVEYNWLQDQNKMFLAGFEADFKRTMRAGIRGMFTEKSDPELIKWITTSAEGTDPKVAIGLMRDLSRLDTKTLMKQAKVPVRCINAAPKFQFGIPTDSDINQKYADFKAVILDGVGHYPMLETPAEFNEKLRGVLKEFAYQQ